jgi:hypothetical protein
MTAIAPVLFRAYPEGSKSYGADLHQEYFNAGVGAEATRSLSTPHEPGWAVLAALSVALLGLLPVGALCVAFAGNVLNFRPHEGLFDLPEWLENASLMGFAVFWTGVIWAAYTLSASHPKAKAWQGELDNAWLAHGGQIIALKDVPSAVRNEVAADLAVLEAYRKGLNRLDPEGDELDGARYALQRYIEVSDIPLLGKRAAEATHIKDPAVRRAAREYAQALKQQNLARQALVTEIEAVQELLADRRQARTDAEIIRLVHER